MKLLLTSSFPMKGNERVADLIHNVTKEPRILYVGYTKSAEKYVGDLKDYGFPLVNFLDISKSFSLPSPEEYPVILLHGGHPFQIKYILNKSGFYDFLSSYEGLIITVSGSSCVLSKGFHLIRRFYPSWKGDDSRGYGLFPYEVLPHSQRYKKHQAEILVYSRTEKVYSIPDGSAISYQDGAIELIGNVEIPGV
ncbi:MAG: Type 1 glutamine amidotransferase-like domain-containing protein [Spirochaetaceae bacterium]|jgi:hypothetical protein|nr:Type 1 glutamine amidotransferase-like domain-containing protein [Spirochaetaceae bacterium]